MKGYTAGKMEFYEVGLSKFNFKLVNYPEDTHNYDAHIEQVVADLKSRRNCIFT
jgi:hypothetical protein